MQALLALADAEPHVGWRGDMRRLPAVGSGTTAPTTTADLVLEQGDNAATFVVTSADPVGQMPAIMVIWRRSGHTVRVLLKSIQEIADEPLSLVPDDDRAESANTHWLSATAEERSALSAGQVISAFQETAQALQDSIEATGFRGAATFYVWHDEQAGQLRCSVSSRDPDQLPFHGKYRPTKDLGDVVAAFLSDDKPGVVPWQELQPADDVEVEENSYQPFPVWTVDVTPGR